MIVGSLHRFALDEDAFSSVSNTSEMLERKKKKKQMRKNLQQQISRTEKKTLLERRRGWGVAGNSEKAFNMITAGMDGREERQRGKQRRGHANIDKYFIP